MSATDELRTLLTDTWQPATDVQGRMLEAGFTVDETRTARKWLGVTQAQGGIRFRDGRWHWRLAPDGCPTCGRDWRDPWVSAADGDYWSRARPAPAVSPDEDDDITTMDEPPAPVAPPSRPYPLPNLGPPRCNVCQKASAVDPGSPCPYWTTAGQRCRGVVQ